MTVRTALDIDVRDAQPERGHGFGRLQWCSGSGLIEGGTRGGKLGVFSPVGQDAVGADAHEALGQDVQRRHSAWPLYVANLGGGVLRFMKRRSPQRPFIASGAENTTRPAIHRGFKR